MGVKLAVHQKHIISFVLRRLDESVLLVSVGCIEVNDLLVLVCLILGDGLAVVLQREILAVRVLEQGNLAFLRPNYAKVVADLCKEQGGLPFLTDCNTLYVGRRKDALEVLTVRIFAGC